MEDIWQQFHQLPKSIRDTVATPASLQAIERLQDEFPEADIATMIMRVMVKAVSLDQLPAAFVSEQKLSQDQADRLSASLRTDVFSNAAEYLGIPPADGRTAVPAPVRRPPVSMPAPAALAPTPPPPSTPAPAPVSPPRPSIAKPSSVAVTPGPAMPPSPPPNLPVASVPGPTPRVPRPAAPSTPASRSVTPPVPVAPLPPPRVPSSVAPPSDVAPTQAYSDEDAQEIEAQTQKLKQLSASDALGFDAIANRIIAQHQLAYNDELLAKRAITIFKSRLKDIRDSEATKDMLTRDPKVGGLGLDPDIADNVVRSLEAEAKQLKVRGMVAPPAVPPVPAVSVPKIQTVRPAPMPPLQRQPAIQPVVPVPEAKPQPPTQPPPPIRRPADLPPPPPVSPATVPPATSTPVHRGRVIDRPAVADITPPSPKMYGPAEELRSMTVADFRRLGQGANESTRKIYDKIQHLKNESFKLWADGVAGWRRSAVYQLYLDMGRQSLEENAPIKDVIAARGRQNLPYLSEHEFTALADLNQQLTP